MIIFDIDGTPVDSSYQPARAWYRALRRYHITVPLWQIHRAIGMGDDQLIIYVAGEQAEAEHGDALRKAWAEEFEPLRLDNPRPISSRRNERARA